ncbi:myb family transcription factor EFM [Humulus lupulus]|uniref:myb family transcription factor EFM n=1 Tax=Humulus lupulus TaxID=3486 RepID=UPI002B401A49|nr:myb family transcription factor EFM [Humulus lupulus]
MMASPSELSLECKPAHGYSMLLKSFGEHQHSHQQHHHLQQQQPQVAQHDHTHKLEDYLNRLEEERLKIEAFKRELPLCMQLLTSAVEASRQQLQDYRTNQGPIRPVLEEFIPLKTSSSEGSADQKITNAPDNKANWMTSAQLWSQSSSNDGTKPQPTNNSNSNIVTPKEADISFNVVSPKLALDNKLSQRLNGPAGAFLPFSKDSNRNNNNSIPNQSFRPLPELALSAATAEKDIMGEENHKCSSEAERRENSGNNGNGGVVVETGKGGVAGNNNSSNINGSDHHQGVQTNNNNNNNNNSSSTTNNNQTHRKARRCWSPDLHRRFVNALQMLGGSQVATPKQIRELMKVDGLTNDEVKSHLQKYRLHTRRPSPQAPGTPAPQLVVLGGIWVSEYSAAAAHNGAQTALYSSHAASHAPPPHYCAPPVPQDFYASQAQAQAQGMPHHHALHHQLQMYKATSQTHSSPESDVRGAGGDRSESIEDGKSESSSWKGESGDNGAERKGLAALREDGEESNGSEITLKF